MVCGASRFLNSKLRSGIGADAGSLGRYGTGTGRILVAEYRSMTGTELPESSAGNRETTILTTDVVGSTALLRRYPNDMLAAMDLHDQILYAAIRRRSGNPFRNTGDGVLATMRNDPVPSPAATSAP